LVAATAVLVIVILWWKPAKPVRLVLLGADYVLDAHRNPTLAVPANAYGWEGLKALASLQSEGVSVVADPPEEYRLNNDWYKRAEEAKEETLVVYMALHGGVDRHGPYLLPQDAAPWDDQKRLSFEQLLGRLEELQKKKKVLLLLDATQVPAQWSLGMLHNDFARALQDEKTKERIDKMERAVVLCSSGVDQRSWVSREYRQTIFTHFVREGLHGAADRPTPDGLGGNNDGRIDAWELAQYVARSVKNWVADSRDALQEPFLLGDPEKTKKKAREISLGRYNYSTPKNPSVVGQPIEYPKKLYVLWTKRRELEQPVPGPTAYTPHLWRRYQDLLLLYEELVKAGSDKVADVEAALDHLSSELSKKRAMAVQASMQNAAALPAALGLSRSAANREESADYLAQLWRATPPERIELWKKCQEQAPDQISLLRLRLCDMLIERVAEEGPSRDTLGRAHEILGLLGASDKQRSAETHFLAMLYRDLDKDRRPDSHLLADALKLRRLAEEVALAHPAKGDRHPYSEYVFPWIKSKVEKADEWREEGQHLLFATNPKDWSEAQQWLTKARGEPRRGAEVSPPVDGYAAAQRDADSVRTGLDVCHQALAILPYYSRWLANRRERNPDQWQRVENLWRQTHWLAEFLEDPRPESINQARALDRDDSAQTLNERTTTVQDGLRKLRDDLDQECQTLFGAAPDKRVQPLLGIEEVLVVPEIPADTRWDLLKKAAGISWQLHENAADETKLGGAPIPSEKARDAARDQAVRRGRLALSSLGRRWFNDPWLNLPRTYDEVRRDLDNIRAEEDWSKHLVEAGNDLRVRFLNMTKRIQQLTAESRQVDLDKAAKELREAERLTRQLDGAAAGRLAEIGDPLQQARALRWHDMLLWEAERTFQGHWFAEDPREEHQYYQLAGRRYVRDAEELLKAGSDDDYLDRRLQHAKELTQNLSTEGRLKAVLKDDQSLDLTSERHLRLHYRLEPEAGWLPKGSPVVWMDPFPSTLKSSETAGRHVTSTDGVHPSPDIFFDFARDPGAPGPVSLGPNRLNGSLHGLYRGQQITLPTPITVYHTPDIAITQHFTKLPAALAVRANEKIHEQFAPQNGALAIVLDCSGSMRDKSAKEGAEETYTRKTKCKWRDAVQMLEKVLSDLPEGIMVSVWVFSHLKKGLYNEKAEFVGGPSYPSAERTIEQIRKSSRWRRQELRGLIDELQDMCPFNVTPLVRAMWQAKEKGFPEERQFNGRKTMLVLTDGMDNRFYYPNPRLELNEKAHEDTELTARHNTQNIAEFLEKEFQGADIQVNMIGFGVPEDERATIEKQFADPIRNKLSPPGNFYLTSDLGKLFDLLKRRTTQKLKFKIYKEGNNREEDRLVQGQGMDEDGWEISPAAGGERWRQLEPGYYRIQVQLKQPLEQRIELRSGDALLVSITADGLRFERVLAGEDYQKQHRNARRENGSLFTIPQLQPKDGSLELMVTLESLEDRSVPKGIYLHQLKPRSVWFELKAPGTNGPPALRWSELPHHDAPAWGLRGVGWPVSPKTSEPAHAGLSAWWNWKQDAAGLFDSIPVEDRTFDTFFKDHPDRQLGDGSKDRARIESVSAEQHEVETRPGGPTQKVRCLLVRLSFPRQPTIKRVWAEPRGLPYQGAEHWFYSEAGKYTGFFWPFNEITDAKHLTSLNLYSVEKFKSEASGKVEFSDMVPDGRSRPPQIDALP
jgi:hypothetical protein